MGEVDQKVNGKNKLKEKIMGKNEVYTRISRDKEVIKQQPLFNLWKGRVPVEGDILKQKPQQLAVVVQIEQL